MTPPDRADLVQVLVEGHLVRNGAVILEASSTITLVKSGGMKVIVDTGSPSEIPVLLSALEGAGIRPSEIDYVVNTHLHLDHVGGNGLFTNARFYAHQLEFPPIGVFRVSDELTVLPGVELLPTPGHTAGSMSVLARADRRYAICGDAVPTRANYESHVPPMININPLLALKSMEVLGSAADVIVPGHEGPFPVSRKR